MKTIIDTNATKSDFDKVALIEANFRFGGGMLKVFFLGLILLAACPKHSEAAVSVHVLYTPVLMHMSPDNTNQKVDRQTFFFYT